jgi:hypothetical protein
MKKIQILSSVIALIAIVQIISCSSEKVDPTRDTFFNNLSRNWAINTVQLDGKDVTNAFPGMVVNFTKDGKFTTTNPVGNLWPASGTFTLQNSSTQGLFNLQRNDGVLVTVTQLSTSALQFTMSFTTAPGGRVASVTGNYTFNMKPM